MRKFFKQTFLSLTLSVAAIVSTSRCADSEKISPVEEIDFSDGGPFSEQRRLHLKGNEFEFELREPQKTGPGEVHFDLTKHGRRVLKVEQAREVWAKIDKLRVGLWKKSYSPKDVGVDVADGSQWSLDFHGANIAAHISGDSAYPAISNPNRTVLIYSGANAVDALIAILQPLSEPTSQP